MKKIVFFLFATMLVASVKAQVYVGGTVGLWHNDDLDATFFKLEPEVGYNLSEKWAVGGVLAFAHGKADEGKYNAFALYNPQIQISAESETKRSIFREKDKTKRSKKESAQHSKSRNKSFVMTSVSAL